MRDLPYTFIESAVVQTNNNSKLHAQQLNCSLFKRYTLTATVQLYDASVFTLLPRTDLAVDDRSSATVWWWSIGDDKEARQRIEEESIDVVSGRDPGPGNGTTERISLRPIKKSNTVSCSTPGGVRWLVFFLVSRSNIVRNWSDRCICLYGTHTGPLSLLCFLLLCCGGRNYNAMVWYSTAQFDSNLPYHSISEGIAPGDTWMANSRDDSAKVKSISAYLTLLDGRKLTCTSFSSGGGVGWSRFDWFNVFHYYGWRWSLFGTKQPGLENTNWKMCSSLRQQCFLLLWSSRKGDYQSSFSMPLLKAKLCKLCC